MQLSPKIKPKSMVLEATITRKDGTIEHLGTIATYHRNPVINAYRIFMLNLKARR